ncbi:MAG: hypothetical protein AB7G93_07155 [Bdellovibrionales bacterium]
MKLWIVVGLSLAVVSFLSFATGSVHLAPINPEDLGPDLPPVGSSLFDKMFSKQTITGVQYEVPYPFERLIARINGFDSEKPPAIDKIDPGTFFLDDSKFDLSPAFMKDSVIDKMKAVAEAFRERQTAHFRRLALLYRLPKDHRRAAIAHEFNNLFEAGRRTFAHDQKLWTSVHATNTRDFEQLVDTRRFLAAFMGNVQFDVAVTSDNANYHIYKFLEVLGKNKVYLPLVAFRFTTFGLDSDQTLEALSRAQELGLLLEEDEIACVRKVSESGINIQARFTPRLSKNDVVRKLREIRASHRIVAEAIRKLQIHIDGDQMPRFSLSAEDHELLFGQLAARNSEDRLLTIYGQFSSSLQSVTAEMINQMRSKWMNQLSRELWELKEVFDLPDHAPEGSNYLARLKKVRTIDQLLHSLRWDVDDLLEESMNQTFIPFGRSLQKPTNDAFDPVAEPRHLVRSEDSEEWLPQLGRTKHKIFCGHVKPKQTVECISYNDEAGRYEFQIITDYHDQAEPQVFYVKRQVCTTCHQNQGPIFPRFPWSETDDNVVLHSALILRHFGGSTDEIRNRESEVMGAIGLRIKKRAAISHSPSANVDFRKTRAGRFDLAVDDANKILRFQKLWIHYCGPTTAGNACRANIAKAALAESLRRNNLGSEIIDAWIIGSQKLTDLFQENAVPGRSLQERDPFLDPGQPDRDPVLALVSAGLVKYEEIQNCVKGTCRSEFLTSLLNPNFWFAIVKQGTNLLFSQDPKNFRPLAFQLGQAVSEDLSTSIKRLITDDDFDLLIGEYAAQFRDLAPLNGHLNFESDPQGIKIEIEGILTDLSTGKEYSFKDSFKRQQLVNEALISPRFREKGEFSARGARGSITLRLNPVDMVSFARTKLVINGKTWELLCYSWDPGNMFAGISFQCTQYDPFHILRIVDRMAENNAGSLGPVPFHREKFMRDFLTALGSREAYEYARFEQIKTPTPRLIGENFQPTKPPLLHFQTYCANCHSGMTNHPPNFMRADSEEDLIQKLKVYASDMIWQMEIGDMPRGRVKVKDAHYKEMIRYLNELKTK